MLTPDAFVRGLGAAILREFTENDFTPVAARVVQPGARELDALYEDVIANDGSWGTYRYRCVDTLFGLGSSLAIVMQATPAGEVGALHERVQRFKGSGPLALADPASLRRRFRSINSILSLLHTSASPTEAALDFRIFFRRDWLTPWDSASSHERTISRPIDAVFAAAQLDRDARSREVRGFSDVRRQFRSRIVVHLWEHLNTRLHKSMLEAFAHEGSVYVDDGHLIKSLCSHITDRVDPQIVQALSSSFTPADPPVDADRLWRALSGLGLTVDRWERAVLSTSQHFEPLDEN